MRDVPTAPSLGPRPHVAPSEAGRRNVASQPVGDREAWTPTSTRRGPSLSSTAAPREEGSARARPFSSTPPRQPHCRREAAPCPRGAMLWSFSPSSSSPPPRHRTAKEGEGRGESPSSSASCSLIAAWVRARRVLPPRPWSWPWPLWPWPWPLRPPSPPSGRGRRCERPPPGSSPSFAAPWTSPSRGPRRSRSSRPPSASPSGAAKEEDGGSVRGVVSEGGWGVSDFVAGRPPKKRTSPRRRIWGRTVCRKRFFVRPGSELLTLAKSAGTDNPLALALSARTWRTTDESDVRRAPAAPAAEGAAIGGV
jgi:hypothetical protein